MPRDPQLAAAKAQWGATAREYLSPVVAAVTALRRSFEIGPPIEAETVVEIASEVVDACGALTNWLGASRVPRGLRKAAGELGAAAGVYRNAAFAFRSLIKAEPDQREARSAACATMLDQGDNHIEIFVTKLTNKLGTW